METAEFVRFNQYVRATTKGSAQLKRMSLFPLLSGRMFTSVTGMVKAIGGNTKDRVWLSEAMLAGEVVRTDGGALTVPDARAEAIERQSVPHQFLEIAKTLASLAERFPLWKDALEAAEQGVLDKRFDQLDEAEKLSKSNPEMSFKQWLLQVEHEICINGRGQCAAENCPGRFR